MTDTDRVRDLANAPEPKEPAEPPAPSPEEPRTPYPVEEPPEPNPGSEPDYFPGKPAGGDVPTL